MNEADITEFKIRLVTEITKQDRWGGAYLYEALLQWQDTSKLVIDFPANFLPNRLYLQANSSLIESVCEKLAGRPIQVIVKSEE